jgi:hypothetical protein
VTVIAWDGKTLAADKQGTWNGTKRRVTKIFRVGADLVAFSGEPQFGLAMVQWWRDGGKPEQFPKHQSDKDDWQPFLVIQKQRGRPRILRFERTPFPIVLEERTYAMGSGSDFATAAMDCGRTAVGAVRVACKRDNGCGNGIDTLTL